MPKEKDLCDPILAKATWKDHYTKVVKFLLWEMNHIMWLHIVWAFFLVLQNERNQRMLVKKKDNWEVSWIIFVALLGLSVTNLFIYLL